MSLRQGQKIKFRPITDCACGDHCFVATTKGYVTLVSLEDRWALEAHSWSALAITQDLIYAIRSGVGLLHRVILRPSGTQLVDHKNRNGCDNRRSNIRICTKSQNCANAKGRSPIKGVSFMPSKGKYRARITVNRKEMHLGLFKDPDDAHSAYLAAARVHFGEFARSSVETFHKIKVEEVIR